MHELFHRFAVRVSVWTGSPYTFMLAIAVIILWAVNGPAFNFSDTWQLIINTGTTISTFIMVFLIQNTQNRDARAIHLKLDELLRTTKTARDSFLKLEDLPDAELEKYHREFQDLYEKYQTEMHRRGKIPRLQ